MNKLKGAGMVGSGNMQGTEVIKRRNYNTSSQDMVD